MICNKCGQKLPEESQFCTECGTKTTPATPSNNQEEKPSEIQASAVSSNTKKDLAIIERTSDNFKVQNMLKSIIGLTVIIAIVFFVSRLFFNQSSPEKTMDQYFQSISTTSYHDVWLLFTEEKQKEYTSVDDESFKTSVQLKKDWYLSSYGSNWLSERNISVIFQSENNAVVVVDFSLNNSKENFKLQRVGEKWKISNYFKLNQ